MPRAFTESEREKLEAKLVGVGKKLVNRLGIRRLSVDDVVKEVGISKGSFYSFFPSREDFILSVFESWETEYRGRLLKEVTESAGSPRERMERFFIGAFEIIEREPGLATLGLKDIETIIERLPPERLARHQANDSRVLEETFERWGAQGVIDPAMLVAMRGLIPALFSIAMHKDDFPAGTYQPTVRLLAEALALRICSGPNDTGGES